MENFNSDIFCKRVNELFGKTGQKELSNKLGISQSLISDIINGNVKSPRADTIFSIANHFSVSVDWLLGLTDVKSTNKATKSLCDTLGLSEQTIETLQEKTNINDAINFLFYQDNVHKRLQELNEETNSHETIFACDSWSSFSILKLLTEFVELANTSYKNDIFYSITPDGVMQIGQTQFDEHGDIEGVKMEKSFDTHLKNNGFLISSMCASRMQRIINLLTVQLQNFVEDKIILASDAERK